MTHQAAATATAPWWVRMFTPIAKPLLGAGLPLGFNGLVTIRGRASGLPRTTPVAVIQYQGRRWIWAPWGEVHWVRNLRAAGRATITVRRKQEDVTATELDQPEREWFFRDVIPILLGGGTPLFEGPEDRSIELAGEGSVDPGGVARLRYAVRVPSSAAPVG